MRLGTHKSRGGTITADAIPDRRRAEGLGDLPIGGGAQDICRIDASRPRGIHVGNDRRHAHRAVEQAKQRKARQIDLARLDGIERLQLHDLLIEIAVAIEHAFGRAGAAGGENDRRRVIGRHGQRRRGRIATSGQRFQIDRARQPATAGNEDVEPCLGKAPRKHAAHGVYAADAHEALRLGLGEAAHEVFAAHARVDKDRHYAGLEQRKDQRDKLDARRHEQSQPRAGRDADLLQPTGDAAAQLVELAKGDLVVLRRRVRRCARRRRRVADERPARSRARRDHGRRIGAQTGHRGQPQRHIRRRSRRCGRMSGGLGGEIHR